MNCGRRAPPIGPLPATGVGLSATSRWSSASPADVRTLEVNRLQIPLWLSRTGPTLTCTISQDDPSSSLGPLGITRAAARVIARAGASVMITVRVVEKGDAAASSMSETVTVQVGSSGSAFGTRVRLEFCEPFGALTAKPEQ